MAPTSPWILVCPASRGIGHALARRLLATTRLPVLATTRALDTRAAKAALLSGLDLPPSSPASAAAARLSVVRCDVTDEASMRAAAAAARDLFPPATHHLRLACAVPGVLAVEKSPRQVDAGAALDAFRVNAVGPLLLAKHFFDFLPRRATQLEDDDERQQGQGHDGHGDGGLAQIRLPRHAVWLSMAARVGSTTDNRAGGWFSYRASKAAVVSLTRSLDLFLEARSGPRAAAVAYHPGTVKTDFSRDFWDTTPGDKLFTPEYAAERMVDVIRRQTLEQRGRCWDWRGQEVPP